MNNKNDKLLCTFVNKKKLPYIIQRLQQKYEHLKILLFQDVNNPNKMFCIYNIHEKLCMFPYTIVINRNKKTKTFYTIDSLNYLKNINTDIEWDKHEKSILLVKNDNLITIKLRLNSIIQK